MAPRVGGITIRGLAGIESADIWLIEGKLNDKSKSGLVARNPADALVERRVPAFMRIRDEELLVLPSTVLKAAEIYSVAALGAGVLTVFETRPDELALASRVGSSAIARGGHAIYCAMARGVPKSEAISRQELLSSEVELPLAGSIRAELGVGSSRLFSDSCFQLEVPLGSEAFLLPPRAAFGLWLDPAPIFLKESSLESEPCGTEGCLSLRHSMIESTIVPSVGFFEGRFEDERVRGFAEGRALRVRLNEAEVDYACEAVFEIDGHLIEVTQVLNSGASEAVFVLNEVLADPNGPEPASEWVEITNVGNREASLGGYRFADGDGETVLPDVSLGPGEFGLIVRLDYQPNVGTDVLPAATSRPIPVPMIGASGLKNDGERLTLSDPFGVLLSQIPNIPAKPGQSSARVDPFGSDAPESFVYATPTPGAPNDVAPSDRK